MPHKKPRYQLVEPKRQFKKFFKTHRQYTEYILEFQSDVTENPFRHARIPDKIVKLHPEDRYPPSSYRWKKRDLRIVYSVQKKEKIVLPLDADTAGSIGYRK